LVSLTKRRSQMISFIVPAHNEEALIGHTLESLIEAADSISEPFEIVVADDSSTDRTCAVAEEHGARVVRASHRQIAATRNSGARAAFGNKLFFVDADTVIDSTVLAAALRTMRDGAVGGGSAVHFEGRLPAWARFVHPAFTFICRAAGFACGCFLFCTREAFEAAGGFDEEYYWAEEVIMSRALRKVGRFVILREPVITSGRKLRAYTGVEIFSILGRLCLKGRKSAPHREGKEIWYGERRNDPDLAEASD